jgi:biopolymer transport protein ExbD
VALTVKERKSPKLDLGPMIDVIFNILVYFIISINMEPSLDEILRLPDALNSQDQPEARFQVYVLKARIEPGGDVSPDSAGLIALMSAGDPDSIFVKLDQLPDRLKIRREEVLAQLVQRENNKNIQQHKPPVTPERRKEIEEEMTLMIKADDLTFYGRIIQVVEKAKEIKVTKFALVTTVESSKKVKAAKKGLPKSDKKEI